MHIHAIQSDVFACISWKYMQNTCMYWYCVCICMYCMYLGMEKCLSHWYMQYMHIHAYTYAIHI
jgi:hypothetical protein